MKQKLISYWMMPMEVKPTSPTLISRVCNHFGITQKQLKSKRRLRHMVEARRIIAYLMYNSGDKITYARIGFILGGKSHCDVLYLVRKAKDFIEVDVKYKELVMSFK